MYTVLTHEEILEEGGKKQTYTDCYFSTLDASNITLILKQVLFYVSNYIFLSLPNHFGVKKRMKEEGGWGHSKIKLLISENTDYFWFKLICFGPLYQKLV